MRQLKRLHNPAIYGYRVWQSCWLLMDYIKQEGLSEGLGIMDIGCGWGLAGIYCAKNHNSVVTCVDADPKVFPFVDLHSEANLVEIETRNLTFDQIQAEHFENIDVIIGADICFWEEMVSPLIMLIDRALASGVGLVLIADPGRGPFFRLGDYFAKNHDGKTMPWRVERPYPVSGSILKVGTRAGGRRRSRMI
ncbi:MAG: methyltransferase [Pseudomonadota bacterium]